MFYSYFSLYQKQQLLAILNTCTTTQDFSTEHEWHIFFLASTSQKKIIASGTIFFWAFCDLLHI
jgi:hypothetical protein